MDKKTLGQSVARYRLTPAIAEKRIKALAADSGNISWGQHALGRMEEREIFDEAALRSLRAGHIEGEPELTPRGEWKCKMVRPTKGRREVGVVVIILKTHRLFVKTVEWEDLK